MQQIYPDYYPAFRCIAGACRHSCCIGWEIDIDEDSAARYRAQAGDFGTRLRNCIDWSSEPPHFILGAEERCPFLNQDNLCDMILTLGEDALCGICAQHPRFHNELPGRVESGVGLCCEAAGALILGQAAPVRLLGADGADTTDEIIAFRDECIAIVQDRRYHIPKRVQNLLTRCGSGLPERNMPEWAAFLLELERLEERWTARLTALRETWDAVRLREFVLHMTERETEYEQFLVYLLYRHMANAPDLEEAALRGRFAAWGYYLLYALGAVQFSTDGDFTFAHQVELARLFSAELEYSEENLDRILDELFEPTAPNYLLD